MSKLGDMAAAARAKAAAPPEQLARIERALRLVVVSFPYLAGLAAKARIALDDRIPTMAVFASGRMIANPAFAARLDEADLRFVVAHELLHLALRTHDRARGATTLEFNYAHDFIINDILREELGLNRIPANGLDMRGARHRSAEEIVLEMREKADRMEARSRVFGGERTSVKAALGKSGGRGDEQGDVLDAQREQELFPGEAKAQAAAEAAVREAAAKGLALAKAMGARKGRRGAESDGSGQLVSALGHVYRTPWELALQRWLESVAPAERTYERPSRRGHGLGDIVLPGRRRQGWMLNVILDTSGSMADEIPRALGAIGDFCDGVGVDQVRLLQCDAAVTGDDLVSPDTLARFQIKGYGGSDLSPAIARLAADPGVTAALVLTDGDIAFPPATPLFAVLWVLPPTANASFRPPYGRVLRMERR